MTRPTCLVPGCLRRDLTHNGVISERYICGGHEMLAAQASDAAEPHRFNIDRWAQEQAAREAVRTPFLPHRLERVGYVCVGGGVVTLYAEVPLCACGVPLPAADITVGAFECPGCRAERLAAHDVAPGATNGALDALPNGVSGVEHG